MDSYNDSKSKKIIHDVYLSYSSKDKEFAEMLYKELSDSGLSVFFAPVSIPPGKSFDGVILSAISSTKHFIPIITENYAESEYCISEADIAISRSKSIIPICFNFDILRKHKILSFYFSRFQCCKAENTSQNEASRIADKICNAIGYVKKEADDFELLSAYIKSGANIKAAEILCNLVSKNCSKITETFSFKEKKDLIAKLFPLLEKIHEVYDWNYSKEARELANKKSEMLKEIAKIRSLDEFESNNLFYISAALRLIYFDREIRWEYINTITGGDLFDETIKVPSVSVEEYIKIQHDFVSKYDRELVIQQEEAYTADEWQFILETPKYIYKNDRSVPKKEKKEKKESLDDELLIQVASFMREGNKIFDLISENHQAEDFFRCLILSYERLKKYCEFVGEEKVCAECIDRIFELNKKINSGFVKTNSGTKAQDGIKTLLGLTIPKTGEFDVFISHKSEDADIAEDMYYYLKQNLKEAFYDKKSLPEMSESQYRKSIMRALDGSKHFVLIISDLSYLESYWVKLEMEIFQSEIDEGRKPDSNFIMVVTNDVYDEITSSNKSVIPIEYRRCEIMKVEEYKTKLISYLNKKILR